MHWLDLLRLIPVCPKSFGVHTLQASLLAWLRPGLWMQRCLGVRTNWHKETWKLQARAAKGGTRPQLKLADVFRTLSLCETLDEQLPREKLPLDALRLADFRVASITATRMKIHFFTHQQQWLDCIEITQRQHSDGDHLELSCYSFSAAVSPASSPIAVPVSILLFFILFSDIGQNELHLYTLRRLLEKAEIDVEVVPDQSGKQIWGKHRLNHSGQTITLL